MQRWTGDQCLQVFYDLNGAVMLADIISSDHIEEYPGAAEAAAAALQATVRRDPLIAFKARLNVKSSYQPSNSSGLSPTLSSPGTQTQAPQNLQLKVTSLLDLITCSRPEVQTRLITALTPSTQSSMINAWFAFTITIVVNIEISIPTMFGRSAMLTGASFNKCPRPVSQPFVLNP